VVQQLLDVHATGADDIADIRHSRLAENHFKEVFKIISAVLALCLDLGVETPRQVVTADATILVDILLSPPYCWSS
jgi:hypothetical protein